jgi:hypothetical protein
MDGACGMGIPGPAGVGLRCAMSRMKPKVAMAGLHGTVAGVMYERLKARRQEHGANSRRRCSADALAVSVAAARSASAGCPEHVVNGDFRVKESRGELAESSWTSRRARKLQTSAQGGGVGQKAVRERLGPWQTEVMEDFLFSL